jgi:hypothetical protein
VEEWEKARSDMNASKKWAEEAEKAYIKSLDHRAFLFSRAEKRKVRPLALPFKSGRAGQEAKSGARAASTRDGIEAQAHRRVVLRAQGQRAVSN